MKIVTSRREFGISEEPTKNGVEGNKRKKRRKKIAVQIKLLLSSRVP